MFTIIISLLYNNITYLYEAEHPVMKGSGGVVFGQNGTNQNSFNKLLRRHQNVEAMAAVLHTGLENLWGSEMVHRMKKEQMWLNVCDARCSKK